MHGYSVFRKEIYSSMSTITLECNIDYFHDYFNEYPVSAVKATLKDSLGFIVFMLITAITIWL